MRDNRVVWKFQVPYRHGVTRIEMPVGAQILHGALQHDTPTVWALCDPEEDLTETRIFRFRMTGEEFKLGTALHRYIVTLFIGDLVVHMFTVLQK